MYGATSFAGDERPRRLTLEEYEGLPADPEGYKIELVRRLLVREGGPPDTPHARLQSRVAYLLERFHDRARRGAVHRQGDHFAIRTKSTQVPAERPFGVDLLRAGRS
jgi:hypothetical protein